MQDICGSYLVWRIGVLGFGLDFGSGVGERYPQHILHERDGFLNDGFGVFGFHDESSQCNKDKRAGMRFVPATAQGGKRTAKPSLYLLVERRIRVPYASNKKDRPLWGRPKNLLGHMKDTGSMVSGQCYASQGRLANGLSVYFPLLSGR
jgi:hypothetical protein